MGKETFYGDALSQFKIFLVETNIFHSRIGREWCIPLPGVNDQEPIKWSLHLPYKPLESTLSRVDL